MSHLDVYTEAVVISMFKEGDVLDKRNQSTANVYSDSVVTTKVIKSVIVSPVDYHYVF